MPRDTLNGHASTRGASAPAAAPLDTRASTVSTFTGHVAIVHDWCPAFRGGERVLAELCQAFPKAEVFTLFDFLPADIKRHYFDGVPFHTSLANRLPMVERYYRSLFFACPFLIEQFDVTRCEAVISSSAAFA